MKSIKFILNVNCIIFAILTICTYQTKSNQSVKRPNHSHARVIAVHATKPNQRQKNCLHTGSFKMSHGCHFLIWSNYFPAKNPPINWLVSNWIISKSKEILHMHWTMLSIAPNHAKAKAILFYFSKHWLGFYI